MKNEMNSSPDNSLVNALSMRMRSQEQPSSPRPQDTTGSQRSPNREYLLNVIEEALRIVEDDEDMMDFDFPHTTGPRKDHPQGPPPSGKGQ